MITDYILFYVKINDTDLRVPDVVPCKQGIEHSVT